MIAPPTLTTSRLLLRRPKPSDAAATFEYTSDPIVVHYMDWPALVELDEAVRAIERARQKWESGEEFSWRLTIIPDDTPIGSVGCRVGGDSADFGFVLNQRFWGRGYATEASSAVLDWLKSLPPVTRINATCDFENAASARVLEKLGLTCVGRLPKFATRPNMPGSPRRDVLVYSWIRRS